MGLEEDKHFFQPGVYQIIWKDLLSNVIANIILFVGRELDIYPSALISGKKTSRSSRMSDTFLWYLKTSFFCLSSGSALDESSPFPLGSPVETDPIWLN